jgi:hypothetical protein
MVRGCAQSWWEIDWREFFDLVGLEYADIEVEVLNRKKKLYGFPDSWTPSKIVNYCSNLGLQPLNFPWGREIRRNSQNQIIPYEPVESEADTSDHAQSVSNIQIPSLNPELS